MRIAFAFLLVGVAVFAAQSNPSAFTDEAKAHHWRMLDTHPRARAYASWSTLPATPAEFRKMQQQYRPQDFDMWAKRLRHLRPGMTEKQVMQVVRPKRCVQILMGGGLCDQIILDDAYFADVLVDERTRRMISVTTPLAITYEIKKSDKKPTKT